MTRLSTALLCAICSLSAGLLLADTYDTHTLVRIDRLSKADKGLLVASNLDIVAAGEDWARALLTPAELAVLIDRGLQVEVLHAEMAEDRRLWREARGGQDADAYYTPSRFDPVSPPSGSLMEHLLQLHNDHPDITRLYDIGDCVSGRYDIIAIKVSDNPDVEEPEPEIRLYGNIHGDEKSSLMVVCDVLDWILDNYPAEPEARQLVEQAELWFVPMGNPDGNADDSRFNGNGVDLNRNFWGPEGNASGPFPFSEPETQALRDLTELMGNRFVTSFSFHAGAIVFNSFYNYTHTLTSDEPILFSGRSGGPEGRAEPAPHGLAEAYREGCTTSGFWYTNGADWYSVRGDTNDWSYAEWSSLDTTIEVTQRKTPAPATIDAYCAEHRQAVINAMLKTFQGVAGRMTDRQSGAPLDGTVIATTTLSDFIPVPHVYQAVLTDPEVGDFHRVLQPGTYSIECRAPGYQPFVVHDVVVLPDETTPVDCALNPGYLVLDSFETQDLCSGTGSPGDGILDPGEEVRIALRIANRGLREATGVGASLTTSAPGVSVTNDTTTFPDVAAGATADSRAPHVALRVGESVPCGTTIRLELELSSDQGRFTASFEGVVGDLTLAGRSLLLESFDEVAPPELPPGWDVALESGETGRWLTSGGTVHPSDRGSRSGANLAYFDSWSAERGDGTRLYRTSGVSLAGATAASLSLWMYHDGGSSNRDDRVQVQVSSDGGTSWLDVGAPLARASTQTGWRQHDVDLSTYVGEPDLRVALLGLSEYGNDCHVDDLELSSTAIGGCLANLCTPGDPPGEVSGPGSASRLRLAKNDACSSGTCLIFAQEASSDGYHVYEGTQGSWFSHAGAPGNVCDAAVEPLAGGTMRFSLQPSAGSRYYLVTAYNGAGEGTAGSTPRDVQRSCPP